MGAQGKVTLSRRDMLKLSAGGAGMFALTAWGLAVPRGGRRLGRPAVPRGLPDQSAGPGARSSDRLVVPKALAADELIVRPWTALGQQQPLLNPKQDSFGERGPLGRTRDRYGQTLGEHQLWPTQLGILLDPTVYQIKRKVNNAQVSPRPRCSRSTAPARTSSRSRDRLSPERRSRRTSVIYGFNGDLPGPSDQRRLRAGLRWSASRTTSTTWGLTSTSRTSARPTGRSSTHLHNGHTAPWSPTASPITPTIASGRWDGTPRPSPPSSPASGCISSTWATRPLGNDPREKQSFFWFHDHVHGHTGANVYKGMVGLMPIYDPSRAGRSATSGTALWRARSRSGCPAIRRVNNG